jgi:tripeptide aminopeptidase
MRTRRRISLVTPAILWVILVTMPAHSIRAFASPSLQDRARLAENPQVRAALDWFHKNLASINETHIRLTEIPAPSFKETARAAAVKSLFEQSGLRTEMDSAGNVIATLPGASPDVVILSAHLDTVFPEGTDVKVHRDADRWSAPEIAGRLPASPTTAPAWPRWWPLPALLKARKSIRN